MHYSRIALSVAAFFAVVYLTSSFFAPSFASTSSTSIRRKIWQTSRLPPTALDEEYKQNMRKWQELNPQWRYEVLTDAGSDEYVRDTFGEGSEITDVYTSLKDNILRADLFRYLVLLGDGGVYSDMDTEVLKPVEDWIPQEYRNRTGVALGIEFDTMGGGRGQALLDLQLVNWTIMARGKHGLMRLVVKNVMDSLKELALKQDVPIAEIKATFNDVLACTGPVQLTRSTWQYLTAVTGEEFRWERVSAITEPVLVHDVLILPVTSFGNGQTHSGSKPPSDPAALVHHQFKGSWKTGSHAFKEMHKTDDA